MRGSVEIMELDLASLASIRHFADAFLAKYDRLDGLVNNTKDEKDWIVRGYNISDEPIQLNLKPLRKFSNIAKVNLAEEVISVLNMEKDDNIVISVSGHEVVSIRFKKLIKP